MSHVHGYFNSVGHALSRVYVDPNSIEDTVDWICENWNERVIVTGVGKSGIAGQKFAASLRAVGCKAYFLNAGELGHGDWGGVDALDCVVVWSWGGETQECLDVVRKCRFPIFVTAKEPTEPKISKYGIYVKIDSFYPEKEVLVATTFLIQCMVGDLIVQACMRKMEVTEEEICQNHPS